MSILIYFVILIILLVIYLKIKEKAKVSKIVHGKSGKNIPHFGILESFGRMIYRIFKKVDNFQRVRENVALKGETYANFFLTNMVVLVTNPNDIREVLSMKNFSKPKQGGMFSPMFRRYLADSLLMLNDEPWVRQRKAINSAMSYSKIKEFIPIFNKMANTLVDKVKQKKGEFVEMNNEFTLMTFDVIGKAGFGFDFGSLVGSENQYLINMKKVFGALFYIPALIFKKFDDLPLKRNKELKITCEQVDQWIHEIIRDRREKRQKESESESGDKEGNNNKKNKDLLDLIIEAEKEENLELSGKELHNNIFLFFLAGHDTSSSALTSVLYFLAKYPEYIEQAREEALSVLEEDKEPTFEEIQRLSLCNAIVKESLRLLPPVAGVTGRISDVEIELGGYVIPKGTTVSCSTFMSHFDSKYWENPLQFNPKRFLEESSKEAQKNAYFPFGYGPRRCPGDKFAVAEICATLVAFVRNFKSWELKEGFQFTLDNMALTTKPRGGLPIKFVPF